MRIIDATDLIIGRLATRVAKSLLLGEEIVIVNSEKAIITGPKEKVFEKFKQNRERGIPMNGPYQPKRADHILKRTVRGMLPYKQEKGESALKRLTCFISVPEQYGESKFETIEEANIAKSGSIQYVDLLTISKLLGAKL